MAETTKILIVSATPWNMGNSFGNTFTNLFQGAESLEIYNICCSNGDCTNGVTKKVYQMTLKAALKARLSKDCEPGWVVEEKSISEDNQELSLSQKFKGKRSNFAIIGRDILWKLGRWKNAKSLLNFLEEIKPDVLYLPIYANWFLCDIDRYFIKKLNIPVAGHISDDVYSYPKGYWYSPIFWIYRTVLRRKIRFLIKKCAYLDVFAQNMKEEYARIFQKPCYLTGKGVRPNEIERDTQRNLKKDELIFTYTGNIGSERYVALAKIGQALDTLRDTQKATLRIYSPTAMTPKMEQTLTAAKSIRLMGAVSPQEVAKIQRQSDFLVHVESFSHKAIFETKMSLSTKIIDYLCTGKPVFAVGPQEVNSIYFLKDNGLAITATKEAEIRKQLLNIFTGEVDLDAVDEQVYTYLCEQRDLRKIQKQIQDRMISLR